MTEDATHYSPLAGDIEEIVERLADIRDNFAGSRIVLAGGLGFLGRYFCHIFQRLNQVLSEPADVIAIDNLVTGHQAGLWDTANFRILHHDVTQPLAVDGPVDYVIHAAGIASPYYYRRHPLETAAVAIAGSEQLLKLAAAKRARYTFFSSSEIYGDPAPDWVPTPESYRGNVGTMGPRSCYDESKRMGETLAYVHGQVHGVHATIIRPFNVYGPGMRASDYRVLPSFAAQVLSGTPLRIFGSGEQTRTYCYVTDAMNGFLRAIALGHAGEAYNIGNPHPEISVNGLAGTIGDVLGRPVECLRMPHPDHYPADEPNRRCPDIAKAQSHLGYRPSVSLEDGLARFFEWAAKAYEQSEAVA